MSTFTGWVWLQCRDPEVALQEWGDSAWRCQLLCVQHKHSGQQDHGGYIDDNQDVWKCQVSTRGICVIIRFQEIGWLTLSRLIRSDIIFVYLWADWSLTPTGLTWRNWVWARGMLWPWPASMLLSNSIKCIRTNTNASAQTSLSNLSSWRRIRWVFTES